MVICAVYGCNSRSGKNNDACHVRFFTFPSINSKVDEGLHDLVLERRSLWISRIARKDLTLYDGHKISYSKVCSKHFIKGAPSLLRDISNPDWAPSINLGHGYFENENGEMKRYQKNLEKITERCSSSVEDFNYDDGEEDREHEQLPVVSESENVSVESMASYRNNADGQDRLKYFIFSGSRNSSQTCNVTHEEALKAAETLLNYMENQDKVDHADLILIRGYRQKILENIKLVE